MDMPPRGPRPTLLVPLLEQTVLTLLSALLVDDWRVHDRCAAQAGGSVRRRSAVPQLRPTPRLASRRAINPCSLAVEARDLMQPQGLLQRTIYLSQQPGNSAGSSVIVGERQVSPRSARSDARPDRLRDRAFEVQPRSCCRRALRL